MDKNVNIQIKQDKNDRIGILGTGDFARAFAKRLSQNNYSVFCGSRYPQSRNFSQRDPEIESLDIQIVSIKEAIEMTEIIFLALHPDHIEAAILNPYRNMLSGKIIVDVTNPKCMNRAWNGTSHAEHLQSVLPSSPIVKALNTISAYSLETSIYSRQEPVTIAGDNVRANYRIASIVHNIGFHPTVRNGLRYARELEASQRTLFGKWGTALMICLPFFMLWFIYGVFRFHLKKGYPWSELPMHILNKIFGSCGLTYLSLCYLPGCIASIVQLVHGTKHRAFPSWLDSWLKCRKEIGLLALYCTALHCALSVAHLQPAYFKKWYDVQEILIPVNQTVDISVPIDTTMNWRGEACISLGVLGLSMMCILGIASLPSVAESMSWRQWHFVQSYLGYFSLILAAAHVTMKGAYKWGSTPFGETIQGLSFLSLMLPYLTIASRLVLVLPPMSIYLHKIRRGWERGAQASKNSTLNDDETTCTDFSTIKEVAVTPM